MRFLTVELPVWARSALTVFRMGFLLFLLFLLTLPQIQEQSQVEIPPLLYIAVDDTASMSLPASSDGPNPASKWQALSAQIGSNDFLSRFRGEMIPMRFAFFSELTTPGSESGWQSELQLPESPLLPFTSVAGVIEAYQASAPAERSSHLLLFSDGQWNRGGDAVAAAQALAGEVQQPGRERHIYGFGVGPMTAPVDLALVAMDSPSMIRPGEQAEIVGHVSMRGRALQEPIPLVLRLEPEGDGEPIVQEQLIEPQADQDRWRVAFALPDLAVGTYQAVLSMPALDDEMTTENNQLARRLRVGETREPVLVLTSAPDWEFRFLKAVLEDEPHLHVHAYLSHENGLSRLGDRAWVESLETGAGGQSTQTGPFETLEAIAQSPVSWGAVVLHNLAFDADRMPFYEWLRRYLENGGGLLWLPGSNNTESSAAPVAQALPAMLAQPYSMIDQSATILPESTPVESMASLFETIGAENLPPIGPLMAPRQRSAAAQSLLEGRIASTQQQLDLLTETRFGLGRIVTAGSAGFWRLQMLLPEDRLRTFWLSTLYQLNSQLKSQAGELVTDRFFYEVFETVEIEYRLANPVMQATLGGETLQVTTPTGQETVWLHSDETQPGAYEGRFTPSAPGAYQIADPIRDASAEFMVGADPAERSDLQQNVTGLRMMADATGGGYADLDEWGELIDQVPLVSHRIEEEQSRFMGERWWVAALLIALLGLEWFLRWRQGLP